MNESIRNTKEALKILFKDLHAPCLSSQYGVTFYFDGLFHAVKGNTLEPVSKIEAYRALNSSYLLWFIKQIGRIEEELPSDCPNVICKTLSTPDPPGKCLQVLFDLDFFTKLGNMAKDETVAKN